MSPRRTHPVLTPTLRARGFSLVELVMVVITIGIVAAIAVPRFSRAALDARDAAFIRTAVTLQNAIDLYNAEHADRSPAINAAGAVDPVGLNLTRRLTQTTDDDGGLGGIWGPYLRDWPVNPVNNRRTVRIDGAPAGANSHGWRFNTAKGTIESDHLTSIEIRIPAGALRLRAGDVLRDLEEID
ncbi:MAG: type II secretion system protein [Phycisphaerales bacterium]